MSGLRFFGDHMHELIEADRHRTDFARFEQWLHDQREAANRFYGQERRAAQGRETPAVFLAGSEHAALTRVLDHIRIRRGAE